MHCPRCQHDNGPQAKFCEECGAPLARTCPGCGTRAAPTAKFCPECATPLAAGPAAAPRFASPGAYTPRHLAEKILTSRVALQGERKLVTVLFADMKGSTELLADRDPEEARRILDPVIELMMEAVHRYEGTVNQVLGDGIMALFGAPLAHEDHAVRACYAALRMQEAVRRYAEEVHRTHGVPIQVRVGLNAGEVVVRSVGSDLHMEYTAVGLTTHLAARMEQMALPGTILLAPEALHLAEGYITVRALGPRPVRGLGEPVEVYELTGVSQARSRLQAAVARGLTRFVGRSAELEQLGQALDLARGGQGQVVALVGEAGVGKSRLFWEFTHSHRTQQWLVLESSSVSYGKASAFLPVVDLLRSYFQLEPQDDARKVREKVTGKLFSLDRALEPSLTPLLSLLDAPAEDDEWERLDPAQRRQRTLDGVKRVLLRETHVQPVVLVFEDLHWVDAETQALLDGLVESLRGARLLLLVNYRPEYSHRWGGKSSYRQLRIDPLPPASAQELLDALLGADAALDGLKRRLIERTEGNPFFLEESVRALVETRVLAGERGAYRLEGDPGTVQIPATAQAILAARIDRLAPEDKRLLQAAAVVGKDVPLALLQALSEETEDMLHQRLGRLQAAEFLYEARLFPELEYTFKHALTHAVAYSGLLQEHRRALHARMVSTIEERYGHRLAEHVDRLVHHATRGEVWDRAALYARQAGDRAAALCLDAEAVGHYEQALQSLERLPATAETARRGIDVRLALRAPLWRGGRLERLREVFTEAEALATRFGETDRLDTVYSFFVQYHWAKGQPEEALAYGARCLEVADRRQDLGLRVTGLYYMASAHIAQGQFRRALERCLEIIERLEGPRATERFGLSGLPYSGACAHAAECWSDLGELDRALEAIERGERVAQAADHLYSKIPLAIARGRVGLQRDPEKAIPLLEATVATCREKRFAGQTMRALTVLGRAYGLVGRPQDGIPLLQEAIALQEAAGAFVDRARWTRVLAELYCRAGRLPEARATAEAALSFARRHGERANEAWTQWVLGQIGAAGQPAAAEAAVSAALALAQALGMRPLEAHCHLSLADLRAASGAAGEAEEHRQRAVEIYVETGARFWRERAVAGRRD